MLQSIIQQNYTPQQIRKEEADQECELESLAFSHTISHRPITGWTAVCITMLTLIAIVPALGLLEKSFLLSSLLDKFPALPDVPYLASYENSHDTRDYYSDDHHVHLAFRVKATRACACHIKVDSVGGKLVMLLIVSSHAFRRQVLNIFIA